MVADFLTDDSSARWENFPCGCRHCRGHQASAIGNNSLVVSTQITYFGGVAWHLPKGRDFSTLVCLPYTHAACYSFHVKPSGTLSSDAGQRPTETQEVKKKATVVRQSQRPQGHVEWVQGTRLWFWPGTRSQARIMASLHTEQAQVAQPSFKAALPLIFFLLQLLFRLGRHLGKALQGQFYAFDVPGTPCQELFWCKAAGRGAWCHCLMGARTQTSGYQRRRWQQEMRFSVQAFPPP